MSNFDDAENNREKLIRDYLEDNDLRLYKESTLYMRDFGGSSLIEESSGHYTEHYVISNLDLMAWLYSKIK